MARADRHDRTALAFAAEFMKALGPDRLSMWHPPHFSLKAVAVMECSSRAQRTCGLRPWKRDPAHTQREPGQGDTAGVHQLVGLLFLLARRGQDENQLRRVVRPKPDPVQSGETLPHRRAQVMLRDVTAVKAIANSNIICNIVRDCRQQGWGSSKKVHTIIHI